MKKVLGSFMAGLLVLVWVGYSIAGSPVTRPTRPPKDVKPVVPPPGTPVSPGNLILPPSITTELRWDLVRYEGRYSREATVRITATFKNVGRRNAQCPDAPCRAVLWRYEEGRTPPAELEVLGYRDITTLASGQSIIITKYVKVSCSREFTDIFEAFHDVNIEHPGYYFYHDPDYHRPSNTEDVYDSNLNDNRKRIRERDIMNALWDYGCRPRR